MVEGTPLPVAGRPQQCRAPRCFVVTDRIWHPAKGTEASGPYVNRACSEECAGAAYDSAVVPPVKARRK